ncbi:MAG: aminotransferase class III-fold pyridoxal phosphate-dependent enzyme [Acidimicrobiales bacterium]
MAAVSEDQTLRQRALRVVPGGMYGHQNVGSLPAGYPQFMRRGEGSHIWDVNGREYIDLMCSYGPVVLGHHHPKVDAAAASQQLLGDSQNGPSPVFVEAAETFVERVRDADWAIFSKNGTDATTMCLTIARAATGREKVLAARGSYHGAAPWCTPRLSGVTTSDRANLIYFDYNDVESVRRAVDAAGGDLAAIVVTPIRHDTGTDLEWPTREFTQALRQHCDQQGAALILDDVRCGFRLHNGGSWEEIGVPVDLSAWSKAIANGYSLAATTGTDALREAAQSIYTTGSFWFSAVSMAAACATLSAFTCESSVDAMTRVGGDFVAGLEGQMHDHRIEARVSGPVQMPFLRFANDDDFELANAFSVECLNRGLYLHPRHNWFVSAAMSERDVDGALEATNAGLASVSKILEGRQ